MNFQNCIRKFARSACILLMASSTAHAADQLPDGEVIIRGGITAILTQPTTRYQHGALGDRIEAAGFQITRGGKTISFTLDSQHVFEDRRVRLLDLDGDSKLEAVIIRSHLKQGSAIAVYDISGDTIKLKAQSENIGQANRWLNIIGAADFIGQGQTSLAAVIKPHLQGSLRLYRLHGSKLEEIDRIDGYSNHINGTRNLDLAKIEDMNGDGTPDITLPTLDHNSIATITFKNGTAKVLK